MGAKVGAGITVQNFGDSMWST